MRRATMAAAALIAGLVPAVSAGRAVAVGAAPTSAAVVTVSTDCSYFCFVPAQTTVAAGGTVTWVDKSKTQHNITRCNPASCDGAAGGTGIDPTFTAAHLVIAAGGSAHFTFTQPGTYVYYCSIHGYGLMHGTVTVTAAVPTTAAPVTPPPEPAATDPAPTPATTQAGAPVLAHTGGSSGGPLVAAIVVMAAGLTATALSRRRRPERST